MFIHKLKNKIFQQLKIELENVSTTYLENKKIHPTVNTMGVELFGEIELNENVNFFGKNTRLNGNIKIGRFTSIGANIYIQAFLNPINIGNFCSIARNTDINESNHNYKKITTYFILQNLFQEKQQEVVSSGPINIGNDVWIGAGCKILSGVTIGNGAIIGANAIVTNDIPPYAIAAGNPARVIKFRFSNEIIQNLEKIKWWDWPIEKIKTHKWLFDKELTLEMLNQIT